MKTWQWRSALAAVLALAICLRLPTLTERSIWFDEAVSWRLIEFFPSQEFFSRAAADVHPVLYYLLLWLWTRPFSEASPETFLLWMRLLSVLLGTLTVGSMMLAARVLFRSHVAALIAGTLTAVNSFQIQYAWEARMYTLGTVIFPLALAALVWCFEARTRRDGMSRSLSLGVSLGAFLHVHYYALLSWFAVGSAKLLFILFRLKRWGRQAITAPGVLSAEAGYAISALLFLPWLPTFLHQWDLVQGGYWIPAVSVWSVPKAIARLIWGGTADFSAVGALLASSAAMVLTIVPLLRGRTFGDLLIACTFVFPIAVSVVASTRQSIFLERYFLFVSLSLLLLMTRTLLLVPRRAERWVPAVLLLAVLVSVANLTDHWEMRDRVKFPGARGAAAFLAEHALRGDSVLVSSPFVYFPLAFHLDCRATEPFCRTRLSVRLFAENLQAIPHFAGAPVLRQSDIVGPEVFQGFLPVTQSPERVWVVDTTGFGGSQLDVPGFSTRVSERSFSELFPYQGDIIVREYRRK